MNSILAFDHYSITLMDHNERTFIKGNLFFHKPAIENTLTRLTNTSISWMFLWQNSTYSLCIEFVSISRFSPADYYIIGQHIKQCNFFISTLTCYPIQKVPEFIKVCLFIMSWFADLAMRDVQILVHVSAHT